jgi:hypothetical protein
VAAVELDDVGMFESLHDVHFSDGVSFDFVVHVGVTTDMLDCYEFVVLFVVAFTNPTIGAVAEHSAAVDFEAVVEKSQLQPLRHLLRFLHL